MDQSRENIIEDSQDEIDIGELLRYLKTKWIVIVAVFLIGVIGAGVGTKCLITPKYTAVSKLYVVSASGKNIVNLDDLRLGTTLSSDYTELLKTRPICNEIISDLGLDYTVGQLKSMISIVPIEDTRLLTVSVVSADPEEAKKHCQYSGRQGSYISSEADGYLSPEYCRRSDHPDSTDFPEHKEKRSSWRHSGTGTDRWDLYRTFHDG